MFIGEFRRRAMILFRIGRFRKEIDEELQLHLEMKEADLRAAANRRRRPRN